MNRWTFSKVILHQGQLGYLFLSNRDPCFEVAVHVRSLAANLSIRRRRARTRSQMGLPGRVEDP